MPERLVVVGGDAAGMSAAATARRRSEDLEVVAFERGSVASYSACGLPYLVGGRFDDADRLISRTPEQFAAADVALHLRAEVTDIDLDARRLTVFDLDAHAERTEGFDQLVVATGAVATTPPIPGAEACEPIRTVEAATRLIAALDADGSTTAVVIGAGYLGLEMAEALIERDLAVTLVDQADQVMAALDPEVAALVQERAEGLGITVRLGVRLEAVLLDGHGRSRAVATSAGELEADHVILCAGVRPAVELARRAGLRVGDSGALACDDHQRAPGVDGVYVAGDCAESHHRLLDKGVSVMLGTHANKQGRVAGTNLTGGDATFPGIIGTAATKVCRYEVGRTGLSEREAADAGLPVVSAMVEDKTRAGYYPGSGPIWIKLVAERGTGRLLGGQVVGVENAAKRIDVLATCVWAGLTVAEVEGLDLSYAPPFSGVYDPVLVAARRTQAAVVAAG